LLNQHALAEEQTETQVSHDNQTSQARFQQFRVIELFCVEGSNKRSDSRDTLVMVKNFLLTVLLERQHRQIGLSAKWLTLSISSS